MILSGENKLFCNVFARLFVDLISIFKEPACKKKQIFGGLAIFFFFDYLLLTAMALSYTQSGKTNNLWEIFFRQFLSTGEQSSQLAHLPLQEYLWLLLFAF